MFDSLVRNLFWQQLELPDKDIEATVANEREKLRDHERLYRNNRPELEIEGRTVILVDDGLARGARMRAAVAALRNRGASKIVVAVPVAASSTCKELSDEVDEIVCIETPEPFQGVGVWYENFSETTDEEVRDLLELAHKNSRQ